MPSLRRLLALLAGLLCLPFFGAIRFRSSHLTGPCRLHEPASEARLVLCSLGRLPVLHRSCLGFCSSLGWDTTPRLELLHTKGQLLLTLAFLSGRYSLDRFRPLLPLLSQRVLAAQFDSRIHFSASSTLRPAQASLNQAPAFTAKRAVLPHLVQVHSFPRVRTL